MEARLPFCSMELESETGKGQSVGTHGAVSTLTVSILPPLEPGGIPPRPHLTNDSPKPRHVPGQKSKGRLRRRGRTHGLLVGRACVGAGQQRVVTPPSCRGIVMKRGRSYQGGAESGTVTLVSALEMRGPHLGARPPSFGERPWLAWQQLLHHCCYQNSNQAAVRSQLHGVIHSLSQHFLVFSAIQCSQPSSDLNPPGAVLTMHPQAFYQRPASSSCRDQKHDVRERQRTPHGS